MNKKYSIPIEAKIGEKKNTEQVAQTDGRLKPKDISKCSDLSLSKVKWKKESQLNGVFKR